MCRDDQPPALTVADLGLDEDQQQAAAIALQTGAHWADVRREPHGQIGLIVITDAGEVWRLRVPRDQAGTNIAPALRGGEPHLYISGAGAAVTFGRLPDGSLRIARVLHPERGEAGAELVATVTYTPDQGRFVADLIDQAATRPPLGTAERAATGAMGLLAGDTWAPLSH